MISWLFVSLVITILLTPGPTNTLLASSGIESGLRKSLKLIPAEATGYLIAISLWGILIDSIADSFPLIPPVMKLLSATYIIFLALKLWKTSTVDTTLDQPLITVKALFCATLLNPKALLFASAIFPASSWSSTHNYVIHMGTFLALILPIAMFWIFIGSILVSNRISWLNQKNLKRTASLVLVSFSIPLSYSALTSF
ncbi:MULTISPECIES: LysE family translocator [unclassified Acinetobacter]|uniref:LysE family translocator n=1 Tax=unclassified Acinetobacter TaxID=196816 RepID=UPI0019092711|nr:MULTISPECIES: LysE family transporter [unclassified Acinetobacter]MBK0062483.1 LysE family transporter [Acinetobacter sp. S55]MBK0066287.1 LysE family transporter [Acinetobacter sp. S54]